MSHAIVKPFGILESANARQIRKDVEELIANGVSSVLIDFQDITFMNSSAIGALVSTLKIVRNAGKQLSLCSLTPEVRIMFEITRMDEIFEIFMSQDDFEQQTCIC